MDAAVGEAAGSSSRAEKVACLCLAPVVPRARRPRRALHILPASHATAHPPSLPSLLVLLAQDWAKQLDYEESLRKQQEEGERLRAEGDGGGDGKGFLSLRSKVDLNSMDVDLSQQLRARKSSAAAASSSSSSPAAPRQPRPRQAPWFATVPPTRVEQRQWQRSGKFSRKVVAVAPTNEAEQVRYHCLPALPCPACLPARLPACLPAHPPACLPACLPACPALPACPPACLACLPACCCVCLSRHGPSPCAILSTADAAPACMPRLAPPSPHSRGQRAGRNRPHLAAVPPAQTLHPTCLPAGGAGCQGGG